jgi:hypothetical protein
MTISYVKKTINYSLNKISSFDLNQMPSDLGFSYTFGLWYWLSTFIIQNINIAVKINNFLQNLFK